MLDSQNYQTLKEAYYRLKTDMEKDNYYEETSNQLFQKVREAIINSGDLHEIMEFMNHVFLSNKAEAIGSVGNGKMNKKNFAIFLSDTKTQELLAKLLKLVQKGDFKYSLVKNIKEIGF